MRVGICAGPLSGCRVRLGTLPVASQVVLLRVRRCNVYCACVGLVMLAIVFGSPACQASQPDQFSSLGSAADVVPALLLQPVAVLLRKPSRPFPCTRSSASALKALRIAKTFRGRPPRTVLSQICISAWVGPESHGTSFLLYGAKFISDSFGATVEEGCACSAHAVV